MDALKSPAVFRRRRADLAPEGAAQTFFLAEAAMGCDPFDRHVALFEAAANRLDADLFHHARRRHSHLRGINPREGARAHAGLFGEPLDAQIAGDILGNPVVQRRETIGRIAVGGRDLCFERSRKTAIARRAD